MGTQEDWLLRPVAAGMCRYESLQDGTLDLFDVWRMNEKISVDQENRGRLERAAMSHPSSFHDPH